MSRLNFQSKPIFAMAQPVALPGSCRHAGETIQQISDRLREEVHLLLDGGVDGVILQNFHDGKTIQMCLSAFWSVGMALPQLLWLTRHRQILSAWNMYTVGQS